MSVLRHNIFRCRRGFSMFELLVVLLITMMVAGALVTLLMTQTQLSATQNRNIINQEGLRDAIRFLGDEISNAGSNAAEPYFILATDTTIEFVGDQDGDGSPDKVNYEQSGTDIVRKVYSTSDEGTTWNLVHTDTLLSNVTTLSFTYFAFNNVTPLDNSEITSVEMLIRVDTNQDTTAFTSGRVAGEAMMRRVTIRNRNL